MGTGAPQGVPSRHTRCLSYSALKIDLFAMAFLELQWLVSPLVHPGHSLPSGPGALPTMLPLHRWPSACRTTRPRR